MILSTTGRISLLALSLCAMAGGALGLSSTSLSSFVLLVAATGFGAVILAPTASTVIARIQDANLSIPANTRVLLWAGRFFLILAAAWKQSSGGSVFVLMIGLILILLTSRSLMDRITVPMGIVVLLGLAIASWAGGALIATSISILWFLTFSAIAASATMWIILYENVERPPAQEIVFMLADGVLIYLVANLVGHFVFGLADGGRLSEGQLGIDEFGARVTFPFSLGITTAPTLASAYAVSTILSLRGVSVERRLLHGAGIIVAVTVIVLGGGRTAAIAGLVALPFFFIASRTAMFLLPALALAALSLPFWWNPTQPLITPVLEESSTFSPWFDHNETEQFVTLQNRTLVWEAVVGELPGIPLGHWLVGYGAQGQVTSGISRSYASLFGFIANPLDGDAHNSILQQLLDTGIVGAAILLFLILFTARKLQRLHASADEPDKIFVAALGAMFLIMAVGAGNDTQLTPGLPRATFWLFVLLLGITSVWDKRPGRDRQRGYREPH